MNQLLTHTQPERLLATPRARGVASVEAVVALPFFILIFLALFYVRDELLKKHQLGMTARTCAWLYSESNCQVVPPGCQNYLSALRPTSSKAGNELHDAMSEVESKTHDFTKLVSNVVTGLIDNIIDAAFSQSFDAAPKSSVPRPALFGGGSKGISGKYHMECNLAEKKPIDVVTDAWNIVKP